MKQILKVRIGSKGTRLVEVVKRSPGAISSGWRVDSDGVRWGTRKGDVLPTELVLFRDADVICEMRMNLHYGTLEPCEGR